MKAVQVLRPTGTPEQVVPPMPELSQGVAETVADDQLTREDIIGKPVEWINEQRDAGRLQKLLGQKQ